MAARWTAFSLVTTLAACSSHSLEAHDAGEPDTSSTTDTGSTDTGSTDDASGSFRDFAFVANYLSGISGFAIEDGGELVGLASSPFDPQRRFYGVALHPSRPILYAAEYTGHRVDAYQIDPTTGALSPLGQPVELDHPVISIAVDPQGRFVYAGDFDDVDFTNQGIHTLAIDAGGALSSRPVASLGRPGAAGVLAPDPSGHFVYSTEQGVAAFAVDDAGALSELTTSPFAATTVGGGWLAFHPSASVAYIARRALAGFTIEPTGALSDLTGSPFAGGASTDPGEISVAVDPRGRFLCVVDMSVGTLTVYAIHADGGVVVPGASYQAGSSAYSVAIDPDGRFVYVATDFGDVAAFSVDPTSFALSPLARSPLVSVVGNQPEMVIFRAGAL